MMMWCGAKLEALGAVPMQAKLVACACKTGILGCWAVSVLSYIGLRRWARDSGASVRGYGELAAVGVPLALGTCLVWRPSPEHKLAS